MMILVERGMVDVFGLGVKYMGGIRGEWAKEVSVKIHIHTYTYTRSEIEAFK